MPRPERMSRARAAGALLAIVLLTSTQTAAAAEPESLLREFRRAGGIITTAQRCIWLDFFLAERREQQAQGLMFIRHLEEFEGMIFGYDPPSQVSMWMKNTYIPLDMIFIGADGRIAGVTRDTKPLSEDTITAPGPVSIVLEVNAGFAARHRVSRGDRLTILR